MLDQCKSFGHFNFNVGSPVLIVLLPARFPDGFAQGNVPPFKVAPLRVAGRRCAYLVTWEGVIIRCAQRFGRSAVGFAQPISYSIAWHTRTQIQGKHVVLADVGASMQCICRTVVDAMVPDMQRMGFRTQIASTRCIHANGWFRAKHQTMFTRGHIGRVQ